MQSTKVAYGKERVKKEKFKRTFSTGTNFSAVMPKGTKMECIGSSVVKTTNHHRPGKLPFLIIFTFCSSKSEWNESACASMYTFCQPFWTGGKDIN